MRLRVLAAVAATAALGCHAKPASGPPDAGPPKVTVATPLVRPVTVFTDLTGVLAAVKTADVRPRVSGYLQKILFEEGAEVKEGQDLFLIDPQPFQAALNQAKANLASAEAHREQAAATEARYAKVAPSSVTPEELEQARTATLVARANVQGARAGLEQAQLNLNYTTVKAPFAGRVDRAYVNEGNVVTGGTGQGTILTRVVTVDPIYAYFTVDEQSVLDYMRRMVREGRTATGRAANVPVEIQLRDETGYPHKGAVDFAGPELNPGTGSLQIRGVFPNPGPPRLLRPGLFVRGRIPMSTESTAMLIPEDALATDQAQRVVYVVGANNRVATKPVTLGPRSEGRRVVEGLSPDDRVIIKGYARVQPDMEVEPEPGEIRPAAEPSGPGEAGQVRSGPNGHPGAGAAPGAGGNNVPAGGARGRPATVANPPGKRP
jgi:RND family efflux transporter MFP subunit